MAPTYIIINNVPKNSIFSIYNTIAAFKNVIIKLITELIGFAEKATK